MAHKSEVDKSRKARAAIATYCYGRIDLEQCRRWIGRDSEAWIEKITGLSGAELEAEVEALNMMVDGVALREFEVQEEDDGAISYVNEDDIPF